MLDSKGITQYLSHGQVNETMATENTSLLPKSAPPTVDYALANKGAFCTLLFLIEAILLALFYIFTTYGDNTTFDDKDYAIYRDIMAMLLVGFGYLMTFMKQYGLSSVGFTMMLTVFALQLNLFVELVAHNLYSTMSNVTAFPLPYEIGFNAIVNAEFCVAAVLISYGAIIGQATPLQLLILTIFEVIFYSFNKIFLVFGWIGTEDIGGSIFIHLFGACFGLAASKALGMPIDSGAEANSSSNRVSDVLSLIGTTILWIFWPTFVAASEWNANGYALRCYLNTVISLLGSTGTAFFASAFFGNGKLEPGEIANGVLAGGVAIGVSGRIDIGPGGAFLVGTLSGIVSIIGFKFISPVFTDMGISDNCKVVNLHGWPAVLGGILSAIFVLFDSQSTFFVHSPASQCIRQLLGIGVTIIVGAVGGYLTALPLRGLKEADTPSFEDGLWWEGDYFFDEAKEE